MENPIRRTAERWVYEGNLVRLREDTVIQPKGTVCTYEYVEIKPGASVLALHDNGDVVLVREWKYALERPSLEVVSGGREAEEDPLVTAQRELREEAGFTAAEWIFMGRLDPFTTMLRCAIDLYVARDLEPVPHEREEGEVMEVCRVPFEEAVEMVMQGQITHAISCSLILKTAEWLRRNGSSGASLPRS
jgi:8-oxo-dGTP pyrophosphatase MutT (NUDIX family)